MIFKFWYVYETCITWDIICAFAMLFGYLSNSSWAVSHRTNPFLTAVPLGKLYWVKSQSWCMSGQIHKVLAVDISHLNSLSHTHTHTPIYTHASTHWFVQPFIYSFDYSSFLLYFSLNDLYILFHAWTNNLCFSVNAGQKHRMYWQFASNSLSCLVLILSCYFLV